MNSILGSGCQSKMSICTKMSIFTFCSSLVSEISNRDVPWIFQHGSSCPFSEVTNFCCCDLHWEFRCCFPVISCCILYIYILMAAFTTKLILGSIFLGAPPCIFSYVLLEPKPPLFGILYSSFFGHFTFKTMVMYVLDGFKYVLLPLNPKANLFPYNLPRTLLCIFYRFQTHPCAYYIYIYIWVSYNISLTWIKAILGWFPLLTMIPVRSQWGRYNLPRYIYIYINDQTWGTEILGPDSHIWVVKSCQVTTNCDSRVFPKNVASMVNLPSGYLT